MHVLRKNGISMGFERFFNKLFSILLWSLLLFDTCCRQVGVGRRDRNDLRPCVWVSVRESVHVSHVSIAPTSSTILFLIWQAFFLWFEDAQEFRIVSRPFDHFRQSCVLFSLRIPMKRKKVLLKPKEHTLSTLTKQRLLYIAIAIFTEGMVWNDIWYFYVAFIVVESSIFDTIRAFCYVEIS